MSDKFYVYRPMLDLIGRSEGTDKGRGYNETLAYGAYTGGDVDLVSMTLDQIDALQTKMLNNRKNKLRSSALGRGQIIRTTMRAIRQALPDRFPGTRLYDADCQDEMICYLLGQRGIDKWLAGRLKLDTLISNLAMEWASIPKLDGKGHYDGQNAGVSLSQVKSALAEVSRRHREGQPKIKVPVPVDVPVVPPAIDKAVKKQTNGWGWSGIGLGGIGTALTAIAGWPWQSIALFAGIAVAGGVVALVIGPWIVRRVNAIRNEVSA